MFDSVIINPDICTDEYLVGCSIRARYIFICMQMFTTDGEHYPISYKTIKMQIFPNDNITLEEIQKEMEDLCRVGVIEINDRYWRFNYKLPTKKYRG